MMGDVERTATALLTSTIMRTVGSVACSAEGVGGLTHTGITPATMPSFLPPQPLSPHSLVDSGSVLKSLNHFFRKTLGTFCANLKKYLK